MDYLCVCPPPPPSSSSPIPILPTHGEQYAVPRSTRLNKPDCFPVFLYKTLNIHRAIKLNGILWLSFFSTHWVLFSGTCPTTIWNLWRLGIYLTLFPISWAPNQVRRILMKIEGWACYWGQEMGWGEVRGQQRKSSWFLLIQKKRFEDERPRQKETQWSGSKVKWKPHNGSISAFLLLSSPSLRAEFRISIFLGQTQSWVGDILKALLAPQVIKFLCPAVTEA